LKLLKLDLESLPWVSAFGCHVCVVSLQCTCIWSSWGTTK